MLDPETRRFDICHKKVVLLFEKMLYDNGQLVSLYAAGYLKFKKPLYKEIVFCDLGVCLGYSTQNHTESC